MLEADPKSPFLKVKPALLTITNIRSASSLLAKRFAQSKNCGERIIGRDWYDIVTWRLTEEGRCNICSTAIPGLFEARLGSWGQRRVPIRIGSGGDGGVEGPCCRVLERESDWEEVTIKARRLARLRSTEKLSRLLIRGDQLRVNGRA